VLLARVFRKAGMHVAILSSPTYPEFIVAASATGVPGRQRDDARDLLRVMRLVQPEIERRTTVTSYSLAGFSLGAMNAAFVAEADAREHAFDFQHVLLINPPYNLENSIAIIDRLLDEFVERDPEAVQNFIDEVFAALAAVYSERPGTELTGEDLYQTLARLPDRDSMLQMLVGLVFRLSASAMSFTTDVLIHAGYLIARDARPGITNSLTQIFQVSLDLSYRRFVDEVVIPFFLARDPALTAATLWSEARLDAAAGYLRANRRVTVITNRDDIILAPGDLDGLRELFGDRLIVLPNGGHGGSIGRPDFVAATIRALE
jgi:pimeloyl-ACP methyl ester carboxylesterase